MAEMAVLTGSEKQIAWANKIREEKMAAVEVVLRNQREHAAQVRATLGDWSEPIRARRERRVILREQGLAAAENYLRSVREARFWIDWRHATPHELLNAALFRADRNLWEALEEEGGLIDPEGVKVRVVSWG